MSGGPSHDSVKCEPNLTPLLDIVLQLVMFFMLCTHFVAEKLNESIKLPLAIEAKSLDKTVNNYMILNIDEKGITTVDGEVMDNPTQVGTYMKRMNDLDKARAKPQDWEKGKGRSLVILRGSRDCNFKQINDVMLACKRAGYSDIQLRAIKASPGQVQ